MSNYFVVWEIDAEGFDSPREAAEYAQRLQRDPNAIVGVFGVENVDTHEEVEIDLNAGMADT